MERTLISKIVFFIIAGIIVLAMLLLGIRPAEAACKDPWSVASIASYHADREAGYNERNWGIGAECTAAYEDVRWVGGIYKNSFYRTSVYAGASKAFLKAGDFSLGLIGGAITGYRDGARPYALVAPVLQFERGRFGVNLIVAPKIELNKPSVIGLQIKWRFGE